MKIDQLQYFLETAKHEHVGKAAKALNISPSAISHAIAALEEELGQPLFLRESRRIYLSASGKKLADRAKGILKDLVRLKEDMSDSSLELQGQFRIGGTHGIASDFITPAWVKLQSKNPHLVGELYSMRSSEIVMKTLSGELDLGICLSPQSHPKLNRRTLRKGGLWIVVNKNHSLLKLKESERAKALSECAATAPKAFQGIENCEVHPVFSELKIDTQIRFIYDNYHVALKHVLSAQSWALMPDWFIEQNKTKLVKVFEKQPFVPYEITAIWLKNQHLLQPLEQLITNLS